MSESNVFYCVFENIHTEEDLYIVYDQQFKFPYFGFNWDALTDSLCGLDEWMKEKTIIIINKETLSLKEEDFKIYIKVLYDVCELWELYPDVLQMKVYFPECYKNKIRKILENINSRLMYDK